MTPFEHKARDARREAWEARKKALMRKGHTKSVINRVANIRAKKYPVTLATHA